MTSLDLVIRGARTWRPGGVVVADVGIAAGRIAAVAIDGATSSLLSNGTPSIDARGLLLLPGLIDDHVHFREPGREDKEDFATGSRAAAHGGATTVCEIQNNAPLMTSRANVESKLALARGKSVVNVALYGTANAQSVGRLSEFADLVVGFKVFLAPSHGDPGVDAESMLFALFQEVARIGKPMVVHAEDKSAIESGVKRFGEAGAGAWSKARPPAAEVLAVERAIRLARSTGARIHLFHLSTAGAVDRVADAKAEGLPVTAATCPHYLLFTDADVAERGGLLKVNPSIKSDIDRARLRDGVRDGTIDVIETDHAPHLPDEKRTAEFAKNPSGISCADVLLPSLFELISNGVLTLDTLVERACRAPARLYGLQGKGVIEPGADADLVLVDDRAPSAPTAAEFRSKANVSPYVGRSFPARVVKTFVAGREAFPGA